MALYWSQGNSAVSLALFVSFVWLALMQSASAGKPMDPIPTGFTPAPCQVPAIPVSYFMVEGLSADSSQDSFSLYLSDVAVPTQPIPATAIFVQPSCIDVTKVMNLYMGTNLIALYSNYVGGAGFPAMKVMSICGDMIAFTVFHSDDFTYRIADAGGNCLATALDTVSSVVTLVNCSNRTQVFASATKRFEDKAVATPAGSYPALAVWTASQPDASVLNTAVLPFMMAIKDNEPMDCTPTFAPASPPPAPPTPSLSSAAVIVIAFLLSCFGAVGVFLLLRRYFKRSDYAEMRQAFNENHEN